MIRCFLSKPARKLVALLTGLGAALVASVPVAPIVGAETSPTAAWTIQRSPNAVMALASELDAVSCSDPGRCVAVGSSSYPSGKQIPDQVALIEQLVDGVWTIAKIPAISGATTSVLDGVSCPVSVFCVAIGSVQLAEQHGAVGLLAETWGGSSWNDKVLPTPAGGTDPRLTAVSCAAPGFCVAVGKYIDNKTDTYRTLAEHLDGSTWSVTPAPIPPHGSGIANSEFTGVDCPTANLCEVVGNVGYNDTLQNVFAYSLSGSTWVYQPQVNPGQTPGNTDDAVSCSAADACTSVGSAYVASEAALAEYWDGSMWVRQVTPAPANRPDNALYDVSCDGSSSCLAVGESYRVNQTNGHLVAGRVMGEVWNGSSWSQSPPVVLNGASVGLMGISCPSPTACIAVGDSSTASSTTTLVEAYAS